jgi:hypothetical protein
MKNFGEPDVRKADYAFKSTSLEDQIAGSPRCNSM